MQHHSSNDRAACISIEMCIGHARCETHNTGIMASPLARWKPVKLNENSYLIWPLIPWKSSACLVNNQTITTVVLDLGPCTWALALSLATISNMIFSQQSSCHTSSLAHYCLQPDTVTRDCSFPDTDHTRTNKLYIHLQDLIVIKPI